MHHSRPKWFGHNAAEDKQYLEVAIREGTPQADVTVIINALSTISNFFGATLIIDNGGNGSSQKVFLPQNLVANPHFLEGH